jgi:hypothetical protein
MAKPMPPAPWRCAVLVQDDKQSLKGRTVLMQGFVTPGRAGLGI